MEKHICTFCHITGKNGAQYLLEIPGQESRRVHKPCGDRAIELAPKGMRVKLVVGPELAAERDRERASQFWGSATGLNASEKARRLSVVAKSASG